MRRGECPAARQHHAFERWQHRALIQTALPPPVRRGYSPTWLAALQHALHCPAPLKPWCPLALRCMTPLVCCVVAPATTLLHRRHPTRSRSNHLVPCPLQPCEAEHKPTKSKKNWHYYGEVCQCE